VGREENGEEGQSAQGGWKKRRKKKKLSALKKTRPLPFSAQTVTKRWWCTEDRRGSVAPKTQVKTSTNRSVRKKDGCSDRN